MKKIIISVLVAISACICFACKGNALKVFASNNEIEVKAKCLTSAMAANYTSQINNSAVTLSEGDYIVSFYIANNTGFVSGNLSSYTGLVGSVADFYHEYVKYL